MGRKSPSKAAKCYPPIASREEADAIIREIGTLLRAKNQLEATLEETLAAPEIPPQDDAGGGEPERDPRAASFARDAWPFRNHRTLAEVLGLDRLNRDAERL